MKIDKTAVIDFNSLTELKKKQQEEEG